MELTTKVKVINSLTKKYLKRITDDCIELSPVIEDAFEMRKEVLKKINSIIFKE